MVATCFSKISFSFNKASNSVHTCVGTTWTDGVCKESEEDIGNDMEEATDNAIEDGSGIGLTIEGCTSLGDSVATVIGEGIVGGAFFLILIFDFFNVNLIGDGLCISNNF